MNITAGNLPFDLIEEDLFQAFAPFGKVASVTIARDEYGQATGFGEVVMPDDGEAKSAIKGLNGKDLKGRRINVYESGTTEKFSMHDIFDL